MKFVMRLKQKMSITEANEEREGRNIEHSYQTPYKTLLLGKGNVVNSW